MLDIVNLKNQLDYDPITGVFRWKQSGRGRRPSLIAGSIKTKGSSTVRRIVLDQQEYTAGQLAWAFMTGEFPEFIIDHIDQDPLNDAWSNLRRGDQCVDQRNQRKSQRNKTGLVGVKWHKTSKMYHAFIGTGGQQEYLGSAKHIFEAACLRKRAEQVHGYSPLHGQTRD